MGLLIELEWTVSRFQACMYVNLGNSLNMNNLMKDDLVKINMDI
jgi:hypothetical protein